MQLDIDLFKIESNNEPPAKGRLLLSEPFSQDAYFKRSVVLLTEHNEEGSIGFILNKPVMVTIQDVLDGFPDFDANVSLGGPVSTDTIHYLHKLGDVIPDSVQVLDDLYWGGDFDAMKQLMATNQIAKDDIRFFLGYSGWSPNQLEGEIKRNSWIITPANPEQVMRVQKDIWQHTLQQMGGKYRLWPNFPENPKLN